MPHHSSSWESVVQGFEEDEPDLACGHCGAVLVNGVSRKQFVLSGQEPDGAPVLPIPAGGYWITKALLVPPSFCVTGERRRPIIQCPRCWSYNDLASQ